MSKLLHGHAKLFVCPRRRIGKLELVVEMEVEVEVDPDVAGGHDGAFLNQSSTAKNIYVYH